MQLLTCYECLFFPLVIVLATNWQQQYYQHYPQYYNNNYRHNSSTSQYYESHFPQLLHYNSTRPKPADKRRQPPIFLGGGIQGIFPFGTGPWGGVNGVATAGIGIGLTLGGSCPIGQTPFINPLNRQPQGCVGSIGCPSGFACTSASSAAQQRLCCSCAGATCGGGGTGLMGSGLSALSTRLGTGGLVTGGQPGIGGFPNRLAIGGLPNTGLGNGGFVVVGGCPSGFAALQGNMNCNIRVPTSCPPSYSCIQSPSAAARYLCCSPLSVSGGFTGGRVSPQIPLSNTPIRIPTPQIPVPASNPLGCASGRAPFLSTGSNPFFCTPQSQNCPVGAVCELSTLQNQYICCSISNTGGGVGVGGTNFYCQDGSLPYLTGNQPQFCQRFGGGLNTPCPTGYKCQSPQGVTAIPQSICCRSGTNLGICPNGGTLLSSSGGFCASSGVTIQSGGCPAYYICLTLTNGQNGCCSSPFGVGVTSGQCPNGQPALTTVTQCQIGSLGQCPAGYQCVQLSNGLSGCCLTTPTTTTTLGQCPNGGRLLDPFTTCLTAAPTGQSGCPAGYACFQLSTGQARCCTAAGTGGGDVCPAGGQLFSASPCTLGSQFDCPTGFVCITLQSGRTGCCGSATPPNLCSAQSAFIQNGAPLVCTAGTGTCPLGYSCQPAADGQSYCCQTARCPRGITIGTPQTCTPGSTSACPGGFTCEAAANQANQFICCPLRFRVPRNESRWSGLRQEEENERSENSDGDYDYWSLFG